MNECFALNIPPKNTVFDDIGDPIELRLTYQQVKILAEEACSMLMLNNGQDDMALSNLRTFVKEELLECHHAFTEEVEVDDDRHFDAQGNLVEKSNSNQIRCMVCGKIYNPKEGEWCDED